MVTATDSVGTVHPSRFLGVLAGDVAALQHVHGHNLDYKLGGNTDPVSAASALPPSPLMLPPPSAPDRSNPDDPDGRGGGWGADLGVGDLNNLGEGCNVRRFEPGELIFAEGSPADSAFILESGQVEVFVQGEGAPMRLDVMGPGEMFGEMAIIDAAPRSASVRALTACRCIVVSAAQIAERIESSSPVVRLLLAMSLNRNRTYNTYLKHSAAPPQPSPRAALADYSLLLKPPHGQSQNREVLADIKLESDLQRAVQDDELMLYYQPLVDLQTAQIVGFESLLRWNCPRRGMVSPHQFIDLAEETSLIVPIGQWILQRACADLRQFQGCQGGEVPLFISVNISVRQFQEPHFFDDLMAITAAHGVAAEQIKLEVTERVFLNQGNAIAAIDRCRAAGFGVALDDFGTGYSGFNYLDRCDIDSLKIDQSFIRKLPTSDRAKILVGAIIDIARKLGFPTVAEGIETPEQAAILRSLGCDIGQGYLFSPPVPRAQGKALLATPPLLPPGPAAS